MRLFFKSIPKGVCIVFLLVGVVTVAAVFFSVTYWDWLHTNTDTVRVMTLMAGGVIAVILTLWRSMIAERQANTAQLSLLNERYQKGAEMLGNRVLAVRLGGIYALRSLAEERPEEYHVQIMRLFCAFVRHPTEWEPGQKPALDVRDVLEAIAFCSKSNIELETNFRINFDGAKLQGITWAHFREVNLRGATLSRADLSNSLFPSELDLSEIVAMHVNFSNSYLAEVKLSGAILLSADLTGAYLNNAELSGVVLGQANLTKAVLRDARGLTQAQLDEACANPDNPPNLDGVQDAETGEYLIWRGKSVVVTELT